MEPEVVSLLGGSPPRQIVTDGGPPPRELVATGATFQPLTEQDDRCSMRADRINVLQGDLPGGAGLKVSAAPARLRLRPRGTARPPRGRRPRCQRSHQPLGGRAPGG